MTKEPLIVSCRSEIDFNQNMNVIGLFKLHITRNLRQNGGRPDSTQTFRSLRMAADRYREMYGENWRSGNFRSKVAYTTFADL